jgi:hypothetical protein
MIGVELSKMEYVEKSKVELPVFAKASCSEDNLIRKLRCSTLQRNVGKNLQQSLTHSLLQLLLQIPSQNHPESRSSPRLPSMSSIKSKAPQEEPRDLSLKRPWQLWPL